MAKNVKPRPQKQPESTAAYIIQDLTFVSPDRQRKDIQSLKDSVISAESIHHPNRVGLYDLYHDVYSMDGFLRGIVEKRISTVLNKNLKFIDKKGNENQDISRLMRSNAGRGLIRKILESLFWGISGVEFKVGPHFEHCEIPRKHIKPEKGLITKSQYGSTIEGGYKIEDLPFVWVIGEKNDLGLFLSCSMYAIYKRGNFGDWAQYVEIFGQPVRIMEYDAYDTKTKQELKEILDKSGNSLAMMIPKQAAFQMLDGKASNGDGKLQQAFKDACNEEMAVTILGNTETTVASSSSGYAQSKEHSEQQEEIIASDLIFVQNCLNSEKFKAILQSYGYEVDGGEFEYELELNLERLKVRLEIDEKVSTKVPIGDDYWYDTYGVPKPSNYNELKAKMETVAEITTVEKTDESTKKDEKKYQDEKQDSEDLIDLSKPKLMDRFFQRLADFFDQARP